MKTLKESLFNRKNLDKNHNPYGITKEDMIGDLKGFPVGVVVRMMEEQERQGRESDIKVFQNDRRIASKGFEWAESEDGGGFWDNVIRYYDFHLFFKRHPEYEIYN